MNRKDSFQALDGGVAAALGNLDGDAESGAAAPRGPADRKDSFQALDGGVLAALGNLDGDRAPGGAAAPAGAGARYAVPLGTAATNVSAGKQPSPGKVKITPKFAAFFDDLKAKDAAHGKPKPAAPPKPKPKPKPAADKAAAREVRLSPSSRVARGEPRPP